MRVDTVQTSFVGGELAPALFGRTDIAQYANACAIVENFLIRPYGPAISTPGTEFINACKTGGSTGIVRLMEFVFSRTDSYIIECGIGYFRFFTNGAVVISSGTTPYEITHTYTATEINDIHFAQLNDIIYLAHPSHPPQKLTRLAANSWILTAFPFTGGPFFTNNGITSGSGVTILSSATISSSVSVAGTSGTLSASANIFIPSSSTLGHKNTFWKIGATITDATTGLDVQGYVQITAVTNPSTATATVIKNLVSTSATTLWAQGSWSDVLGWPARVTFHQQRLDFARTNYQPQNVWCSKSFTYEDFSVNGGEDDDAIDIQLLASESNDIKWLVSGDSLIAGTYGGDFIIKSGDDSPLTPSNTNVSKQTSWGSEPTPPKRIGNFFYYVQRFGKKLRELFYFWDLNSYKSIDKTILSPHISGRGGFRSLAYQQNPDTILWGICSDGTIATMTREVDQEVQGWARQVTDGYYESIASIPSQSEEHDEIWVVVRRNINETDRRYIERFKSQIVPVRQDQCFYLHSGLTYNAYTATSSSTATTISLNKTSGTSCLITSSAIYFTANTVGKRIRAIDSDGVTIGELLVTGYTSGTIVVGDIKYPFSALSYTPGNWGVSVTNISGLGHLESETIGVLADGGTDKPAKVVSNGSITLAYNYFVINAGIPYIQKIKTLPQEAGSQRGTAQGKIQRINEVGFKVNRSFKGFLCGGTEDLLTKIQFRDPTTDMGTPESLYTGTITNVSFPDNYQYGSQVLIQNEEPLPIELLSIITNIDTNDK